MTQAARAGLAIVMAVAMGLPALAAPTARARLEPSQVRVGETTTLLVEVRGAQDAPAPRIGAPDGVSVRYVGPQTEISIVNGQMSTSVTHQYSVLALSPGSFDIGPIVVEVGGQRLDAGTVRVVATGTGSPPSPRVGAGTAPGTQGGRPLGFELKVPRTEVYLHERVPLSAILTVGAVRVEQVQYPTLPGEGLAIEKFTEPKQREDTVGGSRVQVVEFTTSFTPLKTGALTLGPGRLTLQVLERRRGRSVFDGFFGGDPFGMASQPVDLVAPAVPLTVLPLPEEGRPAAFTGAVGRYDLDVRATPGEVAAGDPVTVTVTVRGDGDLDRLTPPAVAAGAGWRVYGMQPRVQKAGEPDAPPGTRVFEQVVIPEQAGTVELPPLSLAYFDPAERSYRTITRGPFPILVRGSAAASAPQIVGSTPARPAPATPLGADIVSIKDSPGTLRSTGARLWRRPLFWGWQPVPFLVWAAAAMVGRRRRRLAGDVRLVRFSRAGAAARRALEATRRTLATAGTSGTHDAIARTISDYLAAKLDLPPGLVTTNAAQRLTERGVDPAVAAEVRDLFGVLERERFAPATAAPVDLAAQIDRAERIVAAIERARGLARALAILLVGGLALRALAAPEGAETGFFRGNVLYAEGRWTDAAAAYEHVLASGEESGSLYFNLGNARAKAGELGPALYAYERARRLLPRDPDVAANRAFVRERAGLGAEEPALLTTVLLPLVERMTADELLVLVSVVWSLGWLVLAVIELTATPGVLRGRAILIVGAAFLLLVPQAVERLRRVEGCPAAVVIAAQEATVRFEPQPTGTPHFSTRPGEVLRVLGEREDWVQVEGPEHRRGWVPRDVVGLL